MKTPLKQVILAAALSTLWIPAVAQTPAPLASYKLLTGRSIVQAKNYYLLTLFQEIPAVRQLLGTDPDLLRITKSRLDSLRLSPADCKTNPRCYTARMAFSDADIKAVGNRLAALYRPDNALGKLVADHLIPSGTYIGFGNLPPDQLLLKAWEQDAGGINHTISVYADGRKANYPAIDSISFRVADKNYYQLVSLVATTTADECRNTTLFFEPSLTAALRLLEINEREQAADYEPMVSTVNKAAFDRIKTIKWATYKYTLILVPGAGPDDPKVALSAQGMLRCRIAAQRYLDGLAPFIVVSGGKVHPYKTPYCEALEMKTFLMTKLNIPENAILIDPHARHTTTNMRNTARLIFRYGMPFDKPCITATSPQQSLYITDLGLDKRCEAELKHVPFRKGKRLSDTEAEFYPVIDALQINPLEPLDP